MVKPGEWQGRLRRRVRRWTLLACLCLSGTAVGQDSACPALQPFLDKLSVGTTPSSGDFPDLADCPREVARDLAQALAVFLAKRPSRQEIDAVVEIVRNGYRDSDRGASFNKLVISLREELAARGMSFEPTASRTGRFSQLDALAAQLTGGQGATTAPVLPQPTPSAPLDTRPSTRTQERLAPSLLPWFIILTSILVLAVAFLLYLKLKEHRSKPSLASVVAQLRRDVWDLQHRMEAESKEIPAQLVEPPQAAALPAQQDPRIEQLHQWAGSFEAKIEQLAREVRQLSTQAHQLASLPAPSSPPSAPINLLALERDILRETWKVAQDNQDFRNAVDASAQDRGWREVCDPLLFQLPGAVPEDLRAACDEMLAPVKDYHTLVTRLALIPRLVDGTLPALASEAQELMRLRELTQLLTLIQTSNLVADRLHFRLERWIADRFLDFADQLLQREQQAQLDGDGAAGLQIVRRVLAVAGFQPVDLTPGQTPFDSGLHDELSAANFPNLPDGVVVWVSRNGFLRGGELLRRSEVMVNRLAGAA